MRVCAIGVSFIGLYEATELFAPSYRPAIALTMTKDCMRDLVENRESGIAISDARLLVYCLTDRDDPSRDIPTSVRQWQRFIRNHHKILNLLVDPHPSKQIDGIRSFIVGDTEPQAST